MDPIVVAVIAGGFLLTVGILNSHRRHRRLALRQKRLASAFYRAQTSRTHGASLAANLYVDQSS